jgi:MFS transporter, DHA3 family, macrolide efflux protein
MTHFQLTGFRGFTLFWLGQMVSLLGTSMTRFALTIWVWQETGEATALALVAFFSFAPAVLFSPIAGALVDRWNRKWVMVLSDAGAGFATIAIVALYATGRLEVWHLYIAGAFAAIFESFQFPAFSSAISGMLPKQQYARANGMLSLADSASAIAAPVLAGLLLGLIGIGGVLLIDVVTFLFAISTLVFVLIPQPARSAAGSEGAGSLWKESIYGFLDIVRRPSLLALQCFFLGSNLTGSFAIVLTAPMVLARSGGDELALASVQSAMGIGGIAGGLILSTWGGPKRKVYGVLGGFIWMGLFGQLLMGAGQSVPVWVIAGFAGFAALPILNGSNQAIWQAKVAPDVQGRVFAARRMIAQIAGPLGMLAAGPAADRIFEPAMQSGGALAPIFGWLVGTGAGAGMALILVFAGLLGVTIGLIGYLIPIVRNVEQLMPDHDTPQPLAT